MGPKVQAAIWFVEASGHPVVIAGLDSMERALAGEAGTWMCPMVAMRLSATSRIDSLLNRRQDEAHHNGPTLEDRRWSSR